MEELEFKQRGYLFSQKVNGRHPPSLKDRIPYRFSGELGY